MWQAKVLHFWSNVVFLILILWDRVSGENNLMHLILVAMYSDFFAFLYQIWSLHFYQILQQYLFIKKEFPASSFICNTLLKNAHNTRSSFITRRRTSILYLLHNNATIHKYWFAQKFHDTILIHNLEIINCWCASSLDGLGTSKNETRYLAILAS